MVYTPTRNSRDGPTDDSDSQENELCFFKNKKQKRTKHYKIASEMFNLESVNFDLKVRNTQLNSKLVYKELDLSKFKELLKSKDEQILKLELDNAFLFNELNQEEARNLLDETIDRDHIQMSDCSNISSSENENNYSASSETQDNDNSSDVTEPKAELPREEQTSNYKLKVIEGNNELEKLKLTVEKQKAELEIKEERKIKQQKEIIELKQELNSKEEELIKYKINKGTGQELSLLKSNFKEISEENTRLLSENLELNKRLRMNNNTWIQNEKLKLLEKTLSDTKMEMEALLKKENELAVMKKEKLQNQEMLSKLNLKNDMFEVCLELGRLNHELIAKSQQIKDLKLNIQINEDIKVDLLNNQRKHEDDVIRKNKQIMDLCSENKRLTALNQTYMAQIEMLNSQLDFQTNVSRILQ